MRRHLRVADLTTGNLEGTLSTGGPRSAGGIGGGTCFAFQAPPVMAVQLRGLGFDLVNQANNHSMDYGESGREQTLAALRRAGVAHTGLPGEITSVGRDGIRVAFLGFAPYGYDSNLLDIPARAGAWSGRPIGTPRSSSCSSTPAPRAPTRIHTPYGASSSSARTAATPRAFAHAVIDAGASLVLGSGPHVIRGVERYHGRLIAYSLGNFVGYHTLGGGGVLTQRHPPRDGAAPGGCWRARWISVRLVGGLPHLDRAGTAARLMARLSREDFPASRLRFGPAGTLRLPRVSRRGRASFRLRGKVR